MTETRESPVVKAAARAYRETRFYSDTYASEPTTLSEVSFLSGADFHRASGLLDCVINRDAIIGILPPFSRDASRLPFVVPEDEAELALRQRRIVRAFEDLGVEFSETPRFAIVADDRRGPFACEVAKGLYWEGLQTSMIHHNGSTDDLIRSVDELRPDFVVLTCARHLRNRLERPRKTVIIAEHCGDFSIEDLAFPALLYADGADLIGSRGAGRHWYDFDNDQLWLETNPLTGFSHVTKSRASCLPLVRYSLGRHVATEREPARARS